jgi:2-oxoglutarate dehydrogenase E1 component
VLEKSVHDVFDAAWDLSDVVEIPTDLWKGTQSDDSPWQKIKVPRQMVNRQEATGVEMETLQQVGKSLYTVPEGFNLHKNLKRASKAKAEMFASGGGVDWATGEALAIGSLLVEGHDARLTGQDVERGTFSHRHAKVFC